MSFEFLVTSLIVVVIPGTGVLYTVSSALAGGLRIGLFAAVGCTLGIVPHLLAAMVGLSGVMQAGAAVFEVVRYAGVAYLIYMGVGMLRGTGALQFGDAADRNTADTPPPLAIVRRGILLNVLNPKLTVFFFAFLPQFLDRSAGAVDARLFGLSAIFMLMTLIVFAAYAYAAAAVRAFILGAPVVRLWVQRVLGAVLIGFAAKLATTDR